MGPPIAKSQCHHSLNIPPEGDGDGEGDAVAVGAVTVGVTVGVTDGVTDGEGDAVGSLHVLDVQTAGVHVLVGVQTAGVAPPVSEYNNSQAV